MTRNKKIFMKFDHNFLSSVQFRDDKVRDITSKAMILVQISKEPPSSFMMCIMYLVWLQIYLMLYNYFKNDTR